MYSCSSCDAQSIKWQGRCQECGKWGTLVEDGQAPSSPFRTSPSNVTPAEAHALKNAAVAAAVPVPTALGELDRVLGGGIVPGSVTLLAGEPGIGKSTLVAMLAASMANDAKPAYYASGEESEGQVRMRMERLALIDRNVMFSNATDVDAILAAARTMVPCLLILDSIQTMSLGGVDALPGTPNAVRAAASELIAFAKTTGVPVLLIGQVTKDGNVAGPKTLEHLVDTVLTLEGDSESAYRLLRATKHRFGSIDEVGVFEMTERGLVAVENPSARFLEERVPAPGSVVTCIMEGTRPFLVEIQALVDKSFFANPVRRTSGFDAGRLQMLLAIVAKRAGAHVHDQDIFVNVVGGIKVTEKAADLAVAAAILSALANVALPGDAVVIGELGLGGEVRSVPFLERRLKEAERLGLSSAITPKTHRHVKDLSPRPPAPEARVVIHS